MMSRLKTWAARLKRETTALAIAYSDPRTPWYAKLVAGLVVAYAVSPIDLIPDPIPVLGYLDDLLILPLGVALALRLIPHEVMADARRRVDEGAPLPGGRAMAVAIVVFWVLGALLLASLAWRLFR